MDFKLTYSTMFEPPESLHQAFEAALDRRRGAVPQDHALYIDGANRAAAVGRDKFSPIDRNLRLGRFAEAGSAEVNLAVAAAQRAFPAWRRLPVRERNAIMRRVA